MRCFKERSKYDTIGNQGRLLGKGDLKANLKKSHYEENDEGLPD